MMLELGMKLELKGSLLQERMMGRAGSLMGLPVADFPQNTCDLMHVHTACGTAISNLQMVRV